MRPARIFSPRQLPVHPRFLPSSDVRILVLLFPHLPVPRLSQRSPHLQGPSPLSASWPKDASEIDSTNTASPVNWSDPQQLQEFFGISIWGLLTPNTGDSSYDCLRTLLAGEFKEEDIEKESIKENRWLAYFKENGMAVDMLKTLEMKK